MIGSCPVSRGRYPNVAESNPPVARCRLVCVKTVAAPARWDRRSSGSRGHVENGRHPSPLSDFGCSRQRRSHDIEGLRHLRPVDRSSPGGRAGGSRIISRGSISSDRNSLRETTRKWKSGSLDVPICGCSAGVAASGFVSDGSGGVHTGALSIKPRTVSLVHPSGIVSARSHLSGRPSGRSTMRTSEAPVSTSRPATRAIASIPPPSASASGQHVTVRPFSGAGSKQPVCPVPPGHVVPT